MQTSALFYQTDSWVTGMQEPKLKVNYIPHGQLLQHKEISRGVCRRNIYKGNWDNDAKGEGSRTLCKFNIFLNSFDSSFVPKRNLYYNWICSIQSTITDKQYTTEGSSFWWFILFSI